MPVAKGNRKESKVKFDNNYFKIYADYMRLKSNNFVVKNEMLVTQPLRVRRN